MTERRTLAVVSGGLRQPSSTRLLADRLAAATVSTLEDRGFAVDVTVVEPRDHAHDVVNNLLTGFPPAALKPVLESVVDADGLVAVTPIFSGSYSGLFKSFVDVLEDGALAGMPVLIGATGGTARHSLALEHAVRPLFTYQRALVVPTSVYAAPEDWAGDAALADRVARAGAELAEQMAARSRGPAPDPFALTTSFERLLAGD